MSPESIAVIVGGVAVSLVLAVLSFRRLPKRLKTGHYATQWREIQKMCRTKEDWAHAIIHADMLLDEVMVKKKISGKTMGERMVNAQDRFSEHDELWDAHKFANTLRKDSEHTSVSRSAVKKSLVSFRRALKDLGAL